MRFLAIVSAFFAVTQVAFAAPVFRASHLTTRSGRGEFGIKSVLMTGHHQLNQKLLQEGNRGGVPQPPHPPQVTHAEPRIHPVPGHPARMEKFETEGGGKHTITHGTQENADGTRTLVASHVSQTGSEPPTSQLVVHVITPTIHETTHRGTILPDGTVLPGGTTVEVVHPPPPEEAAHTGRR